MENQDTPKVGTIISAMFLVAGTCIGGGMLALPVATGVNGFFPSLLIMLICAIAMALSALLLVEANLWLKEGAHMISMSSILLGRLGKGVAWLIFLFISYASIIAYTAEGGKLITYLVNYFTGLSIGNIWGSFLFIIVFGAVIDLGTQVVGRVNTVLFIAMMIAYLALVGMGIDEVKPELLHLTKQWSGVYLAIPLLLTTFSFQTMVPSLTPYLKRDGKSLTIAIIGGIALTTIVYGLWQWLILGIVPSTGPNSLEEALIQGETATKFLKEHAQGPWISMIAEYFAFFAIVTSFLGIALGLFDFLSDGLKIKKEGMGKLLLGLLIIVPTLFFATQFERVFVLALTITGGYGDSILNGMMPVLMVWSGRYYKGMQSNFRLPGGKFALCIIFLFFLLTFVLQLLIQVGLFAQ